MDNRVRQALQQGQFITDGDTYRLIQMPKNAITVTAGVLAEISEAFMAMIVDKEEVTLILETEAYEEYQGRLRGHQVAGVAYRLITFDAPLQLDLVGFMAVLTQALAEANVSILAYGSYQYDHLLVPEAQFDLAMKTLRHLQKVS